MANYNFSSTLFSGFSSNLTSSFSGLINEYSQIKSGSYRRLLKQYYSKFNADGTQKTSSSSTQNKTRKVKTSSDTLDTTKELGKVEEKATALQTAATKLAAVSQNSTSLYAKKVIVDKNEDGSSSTRNDYDYDTLVKSVKTLATAYNETLESVGSVSSSSIQLKTKWMMDLASQNKDGLSAVGLSLDKDGRMSLNEDTLRKTDMADLQDFFEGSNTFVGKLAKKASALSDAAAVQSTRAASAYTSTGSGYKVSELNSGTVFNSLF